MRIFIQNFMGNTHTNMFELEQFVNAGDEERVKELAHKMAPMFQQLGYKKAGNSLKAIEIDGISSDINDVMTEIKYEVNQLLTELSSYSKS